MSTGKARFGGMTLHLASAHDGMEVGGGGLGKNFNLDRRSSLQRGGKSKEHEHLEIEIRIRKLQSLRNFCGNLEKENRENRPGQPEGGAGQLMHGEKKSVTQQALNDPERV